MKKDFDETVVAAISELTELSGDTLNCLTGTVMATAFLGRIPVRSDLAAYLDTSRKTVDQVLQLAATQLYEKEGFRHWMRGYGTDHLRPTEVVYMITTEMVSKGLYLDAYNEPPERTFARDFLNMFFIAPGVDNKRIYAGYTILLDYFWARQEGECIEHFARVRFPEETKPLEKVEAFLEVIYEYNTHLQEVITSPKIDAMMRFLNLRFREAQIKKKSFLSSAAIAKSRTKELIQKNKERVAAASLA